MANRHDDYVAWAEQNVAVIPMIETEQAVANLPDILQVPGIDGVYVGPADLSLTLGLPPGNNDGESTFDDAYATIVAECTSAETGVGPSIASGNQVCSGNWALLPIQPAKIPKPATTNSE